jgi:hypothetical protein
MVEDSFNNKDFFNKKYYFINPKKIGDFVFIHVPRTGGRSINIECFENICITCHSPAYLLDNDKIKFSIIRRPYERYISACSWHNVDPNKFAKDLINNIKNYNGKSIYHPEHFFSNYFFVRSNNGYVDYVFKYEDDFVNEFKEKFGFKIRRIKGESDINILTKETINIINKIYDIDFKEFNYDKL